MEKKAVVIGAGFGGLAMAIRLQALGFRVKIIEKQAQPGGQAGQIKKKGYTFDMGPSLITAPEIIDRLFAVAGEQRRDYFEIDFLEPNYRIYFHDKQYIDYNPADTEKMQAEIAKFSERDAKNYPRFMNYAKAMYKAVIEDGLGSKPFMSIGDFLSFAPRAAVLRVIFSTFGQAKRFFKHPNIQFTFSFHPLFIGANPFRAPALFLMIPYLEKVGGVGFTKGGMFTFVESLVAVFEKQGGELILNTEVDNIIIAPETKLATGVSAGGEVHNVDLVVSDAHSAHTYKDLVDQKYRKVHTDRKIENSKYSMSSVLIYLGVKRQYPELLHHTLILSERYQELISDIFDKKILADDFSMYLHVPTRTDPGMAPEGCESMYLLIPVPNLAGNTDWEQKLPEFTDRVLKFMEEEFGLEDLRENIEVKETFGPNEFEAQRNNYLGACWSLEPSLFQIANFRPHNRSEDINNLYLVGASTHPGGGVPGVLLSAETTEAVIRKDYGLAPDS